MGQHNQGTIQLRDDEKLTACISHGIGMIVIPLFIYLTKKEQAPGLAAHAKQALAWQISSFVLFTCAGIFLNLVATFIPALGTLLGLALFPVSLLVLCVALFAAFKAWNGEFFEYPLVGLVAKSF